MKKIDILFLITLIMILSGCAGHVVYRVNSASPPIMTQGEALAAMELSLSMMDKNADIDHVGATASEIGIHVVYYGSHHAGSALYKVEYSSVSTEVSKIKDKYSVNISATSTIFLHKYFTFSWTSEADARSFVDAAYVLSQINNPDERVYRRRVAAAKTSAQPPASTPAGKASPVVGISIIYPDIAGGKPPVEKGSSLRVRGIVESPGGVMDVFVNGLQADVDTKGRFEAEVPLRMGDNRISVTAVDLKRNQETRRFTVYREDGKTGRAKGEKPVPVEGLSSSKYYALLIAVQDYANPAIVRLDYPVSDARKMMEELVSEYTFERENIQFLQNPDRRTIYKTLQGLRYKLTERDNLLIFYAGHGIWVEEMKQGFWLPKDAAGSTDPSDWIPNSSVRDYIKAIRAKHILLISDACFSGSIFKTREAFAAPRASVEKIYELPSRRAMTSGSLTTVPDRSVFVEYLVKRLQENREPYLDSQKLFVSMRDAVINNSPTGQTPLYGAIIEAGDEGGDFIFVRRP